MQIARVLSLLLDYPRPGLLAAQEDIQAIIAESPLSVERQQALSAFVSTRFNGDLMDWQSEYDTLFERELFTVIAKRAANKENDRRDVGINPKK